MKIRTIIRWGALAVSGLAAGICSAIQYSAGRADQRDEDQAREELDEAVSEAIPDIEESTEEPEESKED